MCCLLWESFIADLTLIASFFLWCLQTSPEGDDEEVVESSRPREARVWPVIQWPPRSCVATHRTAKLGPWPSTYGPWSVQPMQPFELFVMTMACMSSYPKLKGGNFFFVWVHLHGEDFKSSTVTQHPITLNSRAAEGDRSQTYLIFFWVEVTATIWITLFLRIINDYDYIYAYFLFFLLTFEYEILFHLLFLPSCIIYILGLNSTICF